MLQQAVVSPCLDPGGLPALHVSLAWTGLPPPHPSASFTQLANLEPKWFRIQGTAPSPKALQQAPVGTFCPPQLSQMTGGRCPKEVLSAMKTATTESTVNPSKLNLGL